MTQCCHICGKCFDPEKCECETCKETVVVTEQGMFGDLMGDFHIEVDPSLKSVK